MTFLAPAVGLIGAAIAVPALISLYLLKLRRKPVRVSSTLLWEQAVQDLQANVPLRWLRWSWLLAMQLAALGCVLIAAARPAIPGALEAGARVVILIDRSASMSARDGERSSADGAPTRLDEAKREALGLVAQVTRAAGGPGPDGRAPEALVIAYAADARAMTGFTSSGTELREAVERVDQSDQPDDVTSAMELVRAMDAGSTREGEPARRTSVVVISDHEASIGMMTGRLRPGTEVRTVVVGPGSSARRGDGDAKGVDNLGIVALGAVRDANAPAIARVFVRVVHAGEEPVETMLWCRVDDQPAGIKPLRVAGASGAGGTRRPGNAAATFEIDHASGGLLTVGIARPDVLDTDNQAALVLAPAARARVLVVGPGATEEDPYAGARGEMGVDRFLLGALREMELGGLRVVDAATYEAGVNADAGARDGWSEFDLIVFDRVSPGRVPAKPSLSIGAGLPALGVQVEPGDGAPTRFAVWTRTHPIFRHAAPDSVLIWPPLRVRVPERNSEDPEASAHTFTELAQGAGGPLVVAVDDSTIGGVRRLVLGFDLLRTNWGPEVSFPVFVASAVEHLTGRKDSGAGAARTTVQNVNVSPAPGARTIRVRGPREFEVPVPEHAEAVGASVSLGVLDRAGVYAVEGAGGNDAVVAVNMLDSRESGMGAEGEPRASRAVVDGGSAGGRGTGTGVREIWHWFVGGAAVLSCLEWIVYALRSRS